MHKHRYYTLDGTRIANSKLKSKKTPDVYGIASEMTKERGKVAARWMCSFVKIAWKTDSVPDRGLHGGRNSSHSSTSNKITNTFTAPKTAPTDLWMF